MEYRRIVRKQEMTAKTPPRGPSINRLFTIQELEALGLPDNLLTSEPIGFTRFGMKRQGVFEADGKHYRVTYQEPFPQYAETGQVFHDFEDCPEVVWDNLDEEWDAVKPQPNNPYRRSPA